MVWLLQWSRCCNPEPLFCAFGKLLRAGVTFSLLLTWLWLVSQLCNAPPLQVLLLFLWSAFSNVNCPENLSFSPHCVIGRLARPARALALGFVTIPPLHYTGLALLHAVWFFLPFFTLSRLSKGYGSCPRLLLAASTMQPLITRTPSCWLRRSLKGETISPGAIKAGRRGMLEAASV